VKISSGKAASNASASIALSPTAAVVDQVKYRQAAGAAKNAAVACTETAAASVKNDWRKST
jgi:hypothetical protein